MNNSHKTLASLVALSQIALPHYVSADENSDSAQSDIEKVEIVGKRSPFGATKTNTPIVDLARTISIETETDIIQKGALNLSQTATYMAGVNGEPNGFATRGDSISSRGLRIPRYRDSIQELFRKRRRQLEEDKEKKM